MTDSVGTTIVQFWYDGEGKRVKKQVFGANGYTMRFVYGTAGELVAEYTTNVAPGSPSKEYYYGPSGLLATSETGTLSYVTPDRLGSPRIVTRSDGTVAGRHDLKPFGAEIGLIGGRSAAGGYGAADMLRQRLDSKERDSEVGLDFFEARHFSAPMGRFISIDPLVASAVVDHPQTWNRYSFVLNNPPLLTDPTGLYVFDSSVTPDQRTKFERALEQGYNILKTLDEGSEDWFLLKRSLDVYGAKGVDNGVTIKTEDCKLDGQTQVSAKTVAPTLANPTGQQIVVSFDPDFYKRPVQLTTIAHEGSHAADASIAVQTGFVAVTVPSRYETEVRAYTVTGIVGQALYPNGMQGLYTGYIELKVSGKRSLAAPVFPYVYSLWWNPVDIPTLRRANIDRYLATPKKFGGYGLTPSDNGAAFPTGP